MSTRTATLIGFTAILMWSLLALLTAASGKVPPFQLAALTFAIGGGLGALSWIARPGAVAALRQPPEVWALGVGGLFGYHALYFLSLRLAPPAEAGLVNYLWPLLIVLFSAFLPGERLRAHHVAGALIGLVGTIILFLGAGRLSFAQDYLPGFAAAFVAAFVWATYSVMSRRFAAVKTDAVVGFCLVTAALAAIFHTIFETTVWPATLGQWLAVVGLGLGPVGAAFYAWDVGVKRGDIRVLGASSYAAPVLSTGILVLAGFAEPSLTLALAAALIAGGGFIAAKDMWMKSGTSGATAADASALFPCPCCGYLVFDDRPGTYTCCPICDWEDDASQLRYPSMPGANVPLIEAQKNFAAIGASDPRCIDRTRPPGPDDVRDPEWRPITASDVARFDTEVELVPGSKSPDYPEDFTRLYYWRSTYWRA